MAGEPEPKRQRLVEAATFLKLKEEFLREDFVQTFRANFMSCAKISCRCLKFVMANAATKFCSYSFSEACGVAM